MPPPQITIESHHGDQRQVLVAGRRVAYVSPGRPICWIIDAEEAKSFRPAVEAAVATAFDQDREATVSVYAPPLADEPEDQDDDPYDD